MSEVLTVTYLEKLPWVMRSLRCGIALSRAQWCESSHILIHFQGIREVICSFPVCLFCWWAIACAFSLQQYWAVGGFDARQRQVVHYQEIFDTPSLFW